jgi:hypothetical protein
VDEGAENGLLPLRGQEQGMRNQEEKLAGDKKRRRDLSPVAGGCCLRDLRWTAEEGSDDSESWGKTTTQPQGLATREESPNGRAERRLASGERSAAAHLGIGEKGCERGRSFDRKGLL